MLNHPHARRSKLQNQQKEMLLVEKTMRFYRSVLYGRDIMIKTYHANLLRDKYDFSKSTEIWKIIYKNSVLTTNSFPV